MTDTATGHGGHFALEVRAGFSASHCLRHYDGPCEALHGHNFAVEVEAVGTELDPKVEILVDFKVLKVRLGRILAELDHSHLNDHPHFRERNPSSENLARFIFERLAPLLADLPVRLARVTVSEKESSRASYIAAAPEA